MVDGCPLVHQTPDLTQMVRSSIRMGASAPIDEGSCMGRIVQDLT